MRTTTIRDLDHLFDLLTDCPACLAGVDGSSPDDPSHTCGDLDWTDLPTFGGDEPRDTTGIWSWDAECLLIGRCASELEIVSRADYYATGDAASD